MSYNVPSIRHLGGLAEPAQMWVRFCVGTSEATDLAKPNPGAVRTGGEAYTVCYAKYHLFYNYSGVIFPTPVLFIFNVGLPLYRIFPTPERVIFKEFVAHILALPAPECVIFTV